MQKVTFDSNVFQPVVRPSSFSNDTEAAALRVVHDALKAGTIAGFVAERMADLEAIRRVDRAAYFSGATASINFTEKGLLDGPNNVSTSARSATNAHPGVHKFLASCFSEALAMGVRLMRCPRIGVPRPSLLRDTWFAPEPDDLARTKRHEKFCAALQSIEARGVGRAVIEKLGSDLSQMQGKDMTWFEGLGLAETERELKQVADGVSEWADGDATASHIAYENDFFCTRDAGVSAGTSILTAPNREWLFLTYGVTFVTPAELAERL